MEADVTAACGPRGKHDPDRTATRHGTEAGSVTLGGRRVPVTRPRVRATDGTGELPVPAYELFTSTELLGRMAMERMLAGVSTRRYPVALEPVGEQVEADGDVDQQVGGVAEVRGDDRDGAGRAAGRRSDRAGPGRDHDRRRALRRPPVRGRARVSGSTGPSIRSALVEGSTENTTLVRGLLVGLRDRGLDVTRPILAVLDGAKALSAAVKEVFDHPVIGRCQLHKLRNVQDHLPQKLRGLVGRRMRQAYHADSALQAQALLEALAAELDKTHPGAAASLREGMAETLTVLRLGLPPTLARTFRSTNAIESMIGICRDHARNVKRWRDGQMALRWCAAGMIEASQPVPPRQRPPPPTRSADRPRPACRRRNCHRRLQ